jgi:hypothetical protein
MFGANKFNALLKHPGYNFSGGGGGSTTATTYTSSLPEYAEPYFKDIMGRAQGASIQPYQAYTGERIAGFAPTQTAAHQMTSQTALGGTPEGLQAGQQIGGFAAGQLAGQQYGAMGSPELQSYMSPYVQNVVDVEKAAAARDYQIAQQARNAQAATAGAFGGSRQGVMEAEAQRGLMSQLQGIQTKGLQSAYDQAQQARQQQQNLQLQNLQQLGTQAQQLGAMGETEQKLAFDRAQALSGVGKEQQLLEQQRLDQSYQQFAAQRDYEQNMINWYNAILRGTPISMDQTVYGTTPSPSMLSQLGGAGLAAYGMYQQGQR